MKRYVGEMARDFYEDYKDLVSVYPKAFPGAPRANVERAVYMYQKGLLTELDTVKKIVDNWDFVRGLAADIEKLKEKRA